MKKGLILVNAYCEINSNLNQSKRLKKELELLGVSVDIQKNDSFLASINSSGNIVYSGLDYDFCIYLDKDKYLSSIIAERFTKSRSKSGFSKFLP